MANTQHYFHGTGRRKTSVARVRLFAGDGGVVINGKPVDQYFTRELYRHVIEHAFRVSETMGRFNTTVRVEGGGVTGQAEAVRHGIARARFRATRASASARSTASSAPARRLSTPSANHVPLPPRWERLAEGSVVSGGAVPRGRSIVLGFTPRFSLDRQWSFRLRPPPL
jgi:ribosomal protein S9